jgi:hypothetical protein
MTSIRRVAAVTVILVALLAGCGGSETTGSSAAEVAGLVPASAPLLIAFESDPDSEQWQQADELLSKFPGKSKLIAELRSSAKEEGFDLDQDLLPALGDETYIVFLDFEDEGDNILFLTKPRDKAKLQALLKESDDPTVTREIEGWTAVAETDAVLDRFAADGEKLEGADWFEDAQARVEEGALMTLFANGAPITKALNEQTIPGCDAPTQQGRLLYAAATLLAEDDGVRFKLAAESEGAPEVSQGESLLSRVPSGAFAYIGSPGFDFAGLGYTQQLRCALEQEGVGEIEDTLGVRFEQILDLFAGGYGVYTRPATLIPEVTMLLAPKNPTEGLRTLDTLAKQAATFLGAAPQQRRIGEVDVKQLQVGPVSLFWGENDGTVVITTARAGIEALTDGGGSLADDDAAFKSAVDAAGAGDNDVYAYFDLRRLVALAEDVAGLAEEGLPPEVRANLEPLRSFVAFGDTSDPNNVEVGAFLEIG